MPDTILLEGTLCGTRVCCLTSKARKVDLAWQVARQETDDEDPGTEGLKAFNGRLIFQLEGGPTGYESFYIDEDGANLRMMAAKGWTACFGTKDRWDRLEIAATAMAKVEAAVKGLR